MAGIIKVNQYQDFNGNTLFTSDGNGNLTTQNLMYPAFEARLSADQSVADAVATKGEFDTEVLDTNNCYDNSTNYRFTPTVAGKYFIYTHIDGDTTGTNKTDRVYLYLRKNGTTVAFAINVPNTASEANNISINLNTIVDMNGTTDYLESLAYIDVSDAAFSAQVGGNSGYSRSAFGGFRIGA